MRCVKMVLNLRYRERNIIKKTVVFERIGISPSVCILFPFDADEKSTTFASSSGKNAVLQELKSIEDIRI